MIINCRCGTPLEVDEDMLGEEIQCPRCQTTMVAPARLLPAQPAPAQPSQRSEFTADAPPPRQLPFSAQPSQPPFAPQPSPQVVPGTTTSAKAMACLNLGVNSFTVPFILAIPSILFGVAALRECRKYRMQGKSMALTGMTLSIFSTLFMGTVIYMAYPWIKKAIDFGSDPQKFVADMGKDMLKVPGNGLAGMDNSDQLKDPKTKADVIWYHGSQKFGLPDLQTENRLREIRDINRLNRMEKALQTAKTWKELLATP